jgi:hypothetical protein
LRELSPAAGVYLVAGFRDGVPAPRKFLTLASSLLVRQKIGHLSIIIIVQSKTSSALIYLLAASVTSVFVFARDNLNLGGRTWSDVLPLWLVLLGIPLLFAFAYPRYLFGSSFQQNHRNLVLFLNALLAAVAIFLFPLLALPVGRNSFLLIDSLAFPIGVIIVVPLLFVAALSLLFRQRSSLATFASILLWPYFFLLALCTLDRFFIATPLWTAFYFLCFLSPAFLAFAAGAIAYRPALAHSIALLSGLGSLPWIYWTESRSFALENSWIIFNLPDRDLRYLPLYARFSIPAVALLVLATVVAILRLLPVQWQLRRSPLSDRTWPAVAASFLVLALWFAQSVMPYRIPGAVDYSDWPVLQILHVEKRGLQFHETCLNVYYRRDGYSALGVSANDRRLFQYRFSQRHSTGELTPALLQRARAMAQSLDYTKKEWTPLKPLRAWNAEGWYLRVEGSHLLSYTTENGATPPPEVVALFHDLEATPRSSETHSDLKDVCLGFCYDPKAGLGYLYSNHRCFNDGHGTHCE